jgi:hypothetical protein
MEKKEHIRESVFPVHIHAGQSSENRENIFNSTFSGSLDNVMSLVHLRYVGSKERIILHWTHLISTISLGVEFVLTTVKMQPGKAMIDVNTVRL